MVGLVGKPSADPFHRQNSCGDRSNTDGLAYYILHNVKSLYIQVIYQLILYWSIYYIVGLVKKPSTVPFHRQRSCGDRSNTDGLAY